MTTAAKVGDSFAMRYGIMYSSWGARGSDVNKRVHRGNRYLMENKEEEEEGKRSESKKRGMKKEDKTLFAAQD